METILQNRFTAFFLFVTFTVSACGYALVGRGTSLPSGVRSVSIPQFKDKTGEPNIDTIVTRAVKDEFIKDGRLKVKTGSSADSVLEGEINSYSLRPVAYDSNNNVTEYVITLGLLIIHKSKGAGKILKRQNVLTKWRYEVDPSITIAESLRVSAIEEAAVRAAESIVPLIVESF